MRFASSGRKLYLLAAAIAVSTMLSPSAAAIAAPASVPQPRLVSAVPGLALKSVVNNRDGSQTARWSTPTGDSVAVTGRPGAVVTVSQTGNAANGDMTVDVSFPPIDKTDAAAVEAALASYATGKRSLYQDALNLGWSQTEAAGLVAQLRSQPTAKASAAGVNAALADPPIFDSYCSSASGANGSATEKLCNIRTMLQKNGQDWYIGEEMTGSSRKVSSGSDYTDLYSTIGASVWNSGNTVVKYAPSGTTNPSACNSVTYSLSYNGFGVSSTANLCPDRIDPMIDPYGPGSGEFWHGCARNKYVGLNPVDVVHNPQATSVTGWLHLYIHWLDC